MSAPPIEQQISDDELIVPPLPRWFAPATIVLAMLIGLTIWYLWVATDPVKALAGPSWLFLCH